MLKRIVTVFLMTIFISRSVAYAYSEILFSHVKVTTQIFRAEYVDGETVSEKAYESETLDMQGVDNAVLVPIEEENDVADEPGIALEEVSVALADTNLADTGSLSAEDGDEIIETDEPNHGEIEFPIALDMFDVVDTTADSTASAEINTEKLF